MNITLTNSQMDGIVAGSGIIASALNLAPEEIYTVLMENEYINQDEHFILTYCSEPAESENHD